MAVILYRRLDGRIIDLQGGEYMVVETEHGRVVTLCCPICGSIEPLGDHHVVDSSGLVTPAFRCATATCAFHDWLALESYGD